MLRTALLSGLLAAEVPAPPAIAWDAPPGCPDAAELTAAISRRLGRPLADAELSLVGRVTRHPGPPRLRLALQLRIAGQTQTRTLTAERCSSLVDATAVVVAFAVAQAEPGPPPVLPPVDAPTAPQDPTLDDSNPAIEAPQDLPLDEPATPPELPPDPAEVAGPVLTLPDSLAPPEPAPPSRLPGALVRLSGGPEFGAVPGVTGLVELTAGLLWRRARLELGGQFIAPRAVSRADTTARLGVLAGSLLGCARLGRGALELPLCGGLTAGAWRADVTGPGARSPPTPWVALTASVAAHWRVHPRVGLTLALQGLVHLLRPTFARVDATAVDPVYTAAPASVRLLAGVELRFRDPR